MIRAVDGTSVDLTSRRRTRAIEISMSRYSVDLVQPQAISDHLEGSSSDHELCGRGGWNREEPYECYGIGQSIHKVPLRARMLCSSARSPSSRQRLTHFSRSKRASSGVSRRAYGPLTGARTRLGVANMCDSPGSARGRVKSTRRMFRCCAWLPSGLVDDPARAAHCGRGCRPWRAESKLGKRFGDPLEKRRVWIWLPSASRESGRENESAAWEELFKGDSGVNPTPLPHLSLMSELATCQAIAGRGASRWAGVVANWTRAARESNCARRSRGLGAKRWDWTATPSTGAEPRRAARPRRGNQRPRKCSSGFSYREAKSESSITSTRRSPVSDLDTKDWCRLSRLATWTCVIPASSRALRRMARKRW